jgi:hypothetical protein
MAITAMEAMVHLIQIFSDCPITKDHFLSQNVIFPEGNLLDILWQLKSLLLKMAHRNSWFAQLQDGDFS